MPKKGKKGAEQRVKGNVKTASSGRMSELLGTEAMGFIGFDSVSSGLHGNLSNSVDGGRIDNVLVGPSGSSFQVTMKQLGKRDPTTKLKALQEFSVLCGQEESHDVLAVLHIWALMYNKLSMDNDHRVREASHKALRACAEKLKSGLAPQLKSIIGCWVAGMCDPHGPASTAAKLTFDAAFTSKKQREVVEFGFKSVFKHAEDMILKETPDTFSDPKVVPADERVQRFERALVMAIHSISLILRQVSPDYLSKTSDVYQTLLTEKRVWKMARHENPLVRAAVFSLVTSLCECVPTFVTDNMKLLCSAVLGSLGKDDPVVIGPLWEACLTLITKTENWSEHVNVRKGLLPGLWSFLRSGGHGSAKITYPCLLPLLSILTEKVFSEDADFATLFLERLGSGLHGERVRMSRTESEVVMRTYNECVMYLVLRFKPLEERDNLSALFKLLLDMVSLTLSKSCSQLHHEVVSVSIVSLLTSLLQARDKNPSLIHCLECFRSELEGVMVSCVKESTQNKVIGRLEGLLSIFHTPPKQKKAKGGSVRFSDQPPENSDVTDQAPSDHMTDHVTEVPSHVTTSEGGTVRREYMCPVVCSLCAQSIARLGEGVEHKTSGLLLTLVRLYCADSTFSSSLLRSLRSSHPELISKYIDEEKTPDAIAIPSLLSKLARLDCISAQGLKFVSDMLECVLVLVMRGEGGTTGPGWSLVTELVQHHPSVLPLVLLRLGELGEGAAAASLLRTHGSLLRQLVTESFEERNTIYLWTFLERLVSTDKEASLDCDSLRSSMFSLLCEQLCDGVTATGKFSDPGVAMMRVLCKVQRSTVRDRVEDCTKLLDCLLRWTLFSPDLDHPSLLETVIACYQHLLSQLPPTSSHLTSCPLLVTKETEKIEKHELTSRHLQSAMLYSALHSRVMSCDTYKIIYGPLAKLPKKIETTIFPVSTLDRFCKRDLLFSPLSTSSTPSQPHTLTQSLPPSLTQLLYPAILLSSSSITETETSESDPELSRLATLQQRLGLLKGGGPECIFRGVVNIQEGVVLEREGSDWVEVVLVLSLAVSCLAECNITQRTALEARTEALFQSAIDQCVSFAAHHSPHWLTQLVEEMEDRAKMDGALWLPVLCNTFASLQRLCVGTDDVSMKDLIGVLYKEPKGPVLYAALKPVHSDCYQQQIEQLATQRQQDPCLLAGCLKLLPSSELLRSLGSKVITEIVEKQSELNLFESLSESAGEPLCYSTLELFSLLLSQDRELSSANMDFLLCSTIFLVELVNEAPPTSDINHTLFCCLLLDTVHQLALHFSSPEACPRREQEKEWREFFQPSLHTHLIPLFVKLKGGPGDLCLVYQTLALSRAVSLVCTTPEGVGLERLVDILLTGSTYSQQVAAFKLAQELMKGHTVVLDEETDSDKALRLSQVKDIFSKCFEQINIDLVFFEDSQKSKVTSTHTTSYCLTWLLVIQAMSRCGPESRGALSEWLKELSWFDHLLHGLISLLPHTQRRAIDPKLEVTLVPNLQQLALVTYFAVAKQLPCMLRQWYLTLNRQTSAQVASFTTRHISPHLQSTELSSIRQCPATQGNMEVRVYSTVAEVSVVYRVDEFSIELFVRLPESYPLQPPVIREGKRVRVDQAQWRKWLLQLNIFVTNQNGSLMDGLLLWKSNLDKHFSGVEDCMICFSVIHSSNYSLPKMNCRTCKKRFHSACLYKWFNTSNKSSCPLCRNIF